MLCSQLCSYCPHHPYTICKQHSWSLNPCVLTSERIPWSSLSCCQCGSEEWNKQYLGLGEIGRRDLIQRRYQLRRDTEVGAGELCRGYLTRGEKKGNNVPGQRKQVMKASETVMNLRRKGSSGWVANVKWKGKRSDRGPERGLVVKSCLEDLKKKGTVGHQF